MIRIRWIDSDVLYSQQELDIIPGLIRVLWHGVNDNLDKQRKLLKEILHISSNEWLAVLQLMIRVDMACSNLDHDARKASEASDRVSGFELVDDILREQFNGILQDGQSLEPVVCALIVELVLKPILKDSRDVRCCFGTCVTQCWQLFLYN